MFLCSLFSREDFQLILRRRKIINRLKSRTSNIAPCSNFPRLRPPLREQGACASRPGSPRVPQHPDPPRGLRPGRTEAAAPRSQCRPMSQGWVLPTADAGTPHPLRAAPRCTLQDLGHSEVGQSPTCPLLPVAAPAPHQGTHAALQHPKG